MNRECPKLAMVIPCFNEEEVIATTIDSLLAIINALVKSNGIHEDSFLCFVDDGSKDKTWSILSEANESTPYVKALRLSRNFGHQLALLAGLKYVNGKVDCAITIDADLQQDEKAIPEFIEKYKEGADIVFGIREDRSSDSFFKKWTALFFYKIMEFFGTPLIRNHADYRLTSQFALETLDQYGEASVFLRGIFADMGLNSDFVTFKVKERTSGQTKYSLGRMISFAVHGISSFSIAPLRVITLLGFIIFSISALMGVYILFVGIVIGGTVPGWVSTTLPIYFIGGLQTLCIGVLGEYIGNVFTEAKKRPKFIVNNRLE